MLCEIVTCEIIVFDIIVAFLLNAYVIYVLVSSILMASVVHHFTMSTNQFPLLIYFYSLSINIFTYDMQA